MISYFLQVLKSVKWELIDSYDWLHQYLPFRRAVVIRSKNIWYYYDGILVGSLDTVSWHRYFGKPKYFIALAIGDHPDKKKTGCLSFGWRMLVTILENEDEIRYYRQEIDLRELFIRGKRYWECDQGLCYPLRLKKWTESTPLNEDYLPDPGVWHFK